MKMPQQPRSYAEILREKQSSLHEVLLDKATRDLVGRYNEEYLHWDELRRKDAVMDAELLWALMKMARESQAKRIHFSDIDLSYVVTGRSQQILHRLDKGTSGVSIDEGRNGSGMRRFVASSLMEEAIASSHLEGAVTTSKVAKKMLREGRKPRDRSEQMIMNDYLTMQRVSTVRDRPFTVETVLELHRIITHDTLEDPHDEGHFRSNDEVVLGDPLETGKVYFRPPPHGKVPQLMEELCAFANDDNSAEFQHPLVKAMIIHFMIGYIHAFVDGNGRLARALMYWYALKRDYWIFEYLAVSKVMKTGRARYGMAYLHTETDDNDVTYFFNYNLECIEKALAAFESYVARKRRERTGALEIVEVHKELNLRQAEILDDLVKHRGEPFTVAAMASKYDVVLQTARTDLHKLADLDLIEKREAGNKAYFVYRGKER